MAVKPEAFQVLDESLSARLQKRWNRRALRIIGVISARYQRGDYEGVEAALDNLKLEDVLKGQKKYLRLIGKTSLLFGASRLSPPRDSTVAQSSHGELLNRANTQFEKLLQEANGYIRTSVIRAMERDQRRRLEAQKAEVKKAPLIRDFASELKRSVGNTGSNSIAIASSLHTSRLASYGFTLEAQALGVEHYAVSEQLDRRTCPVCRTMHGKVFSVNKAYAKLDQQLRVDDITSLKTSAPWPKQDKASVERLGQMTSSEIAEAGWDTPPYHPLCRGILVKTDQVPELSGEARPAPTPRPAEQPVTFSPIKEWAEDELDYLTNKSLWLRDELAHEGLVAKGLNEVEAKAVGVYTQNLYEKMNRQLRTKSINYQGFNDKKEFELLEAAINSGLAKLARHEEHAWRNKVVTREVSSTKDPDVWIKRYPVGEVVGDEGFLSTSYVKGAFMGGNPEEALQQARGSGTRVYLEIKSKNGVKIDEFSNYSSEKEVLMPSYSKYRVLSVEQVAERGLVINLEEL